MTGVRRTRTASTASALAIPTNSAPSPNLGCEESGLVNAGRCIGPDRCLEEHTFDPDDMHERITSPSVERAHSPVEPLLSAVRTLVVAPIHPHLPGAKMQPPSACLRVRRRRDTPGRCGQPAAHAERSRRRRHRSGVRRGRRSRRGCSRRHHRANPPRPPARLLAARDPRVACHRRRHPRRRRGRRHQRSAPSQRCHARPAGAHHPACGGRRRRGSPPDVLGRLLGQVGALQRQVLAPRGLRFSGCRIGKCRSCGWSPTDTTLRRSRSSSATASEPSRMCCTTSPPACNFATDRMPSHTRFAKD